MGQLDKKFESAVVKNQLDDSAKVEWLQARLTDDALETFHELQRNGNMSYNLIRTALSCHIIMCMFIIYLPIQLSDNCVIMAVINGTVEILSSILRTGETRKNTCINVPVDMAPVS